jgi:hypothetical protein
LSKVPTIERGNYVVRLRYNRRTYWFRVVSVSRWDGRAWERNEDVYQGEIEVPDGVIMIGGLDGEMQFLGQGGVKLEARDPADPPLETVTTPRGSSWDKPVEIEGEWYQIGLSWGRRDCSHPFLWINGIQIYPEREGGICTQTFVPTETAITPTRFTPDTIIVPADEL